MLNTNPNPNFFLQEAMLICSWQHGMQISDTDRIKRPIISSIIPLINYVYLLIWFYFLFFGHGGSGCHLFSGLNLAWASLLMTLTKQLRYVPSQTQWAQTDPVKLSQERHSKCFQVLDKGLCANGSALCPNGTQVFKVLTSSPAKTHHGGDKAAPFELL